MKLLTGIVSVFARPGGKLAAVLTLTGIAFYLAIGFYLRPALAQSSAGTQTMGSAADPAAAQQAIQEELRAANDLKSVLDTTSQRVDNIQKILAALVTVSSIFGFAVGAFTYVNLTQIRASADKELNQLRADFPAIARMNEGVARVFANVRNEAALMFDGWDPDSYERLSEASRESIRMSELTFSALEFFDFLKSPKLSGYATEIYIAFGRFYGSNYRSFHKNNDPAVERAKIYLRKAIKSPDESLKERALADLGTICTWQAAFVATDKEKEPPMKEARETFDQACAIRAHNPAALIGRAWVRRRSGEPLSKAIDDLSDLIAAAADRKLSGEEKRRYLRTAYFNRACYRALWGAAQGIPRLLDLAIDDLWESKIAAIDTEKFDVWLKNLNEELPAGKDLAALLPVHKHALDPLRDRARTNP